MQKIHGKYMLAVSILLVITSGSTYALPTPDFVANIGSAALQAIGILVTIFAFSQGAIRVFLQKIQKKYVLMSGIIGAAALGLCCLIIIVWRDVTYDREVRRARDYTHAQVQLDHIVGVSSSEAHIDAYAITTTDFIDRMAHDSGLQLIDIRENVEYALGYIPGVHHVRFADILFGTGKTQIDATRPVYFLCSNSMRGRALTTYMRMQGYTGYFLQEGLEGYVAKGGIRSGTEEIFDVYSGVLNHGYLGRGSLDIYVEKPGVVIVDARIPMGNSGANSIGISLLSEPGDVLSRVDIGPYKSFVVVYDDYVSWIQGMFVSIGLQQRGLKEEGKYYLAK